MGQRCTSSGAFDRAEAISPQQLDQAPAHTCVQVVSLLTTASTTASYLKQHVASEPGLLPGNVRID